MALKIAYIEDDSGDAFLFPKKMGYEPLIYQTYTLYMESGFNHDILICDLNVPDFNNIVIHEVIQKENIPVYIFTSSNPDVMPKGNKEFLVKEGVDGFFQKDRDDQILKQILEELSHEEKEL